MFHAPYDKIDVVPNDTSAVVVQTQFLDFRFDTVEVGSGNGSPAERMDIDELRIGTTFWDVVGGANIFAEMRLLNSCRC